MIDRSDIQSRGALALQFHEKADPSGVEFALLDRPIIFGARYEQSRTASGLNLTRPAPSTFGDIWAGIIWPFEKKSKRRATHISWAHPVQVTTSPALPEEAETPARPRTTDASSGPKTTAAPDPMTFRPALKVDEGREWERNEDLAEFEAYPWDRDARFPKKHPGAVVAASDYKSQQAAFLPAGGLLVAPHRGGLEEHGSLVYEVNAEGELDLERKARLQSAIRVYKVPKAQRQDLWGKPGKGALALQLGRPAKKASSFGGLGVLADEPLGGGGGGIRTVERPGTGDQGERPGTGDQGKPKAPPPQALSALSYRAGGFAHPGFGAEDKHYYGATGDGDLAGTAHIDTNALYAMDPDHDGPLPFSQIAWKPGADFPKIVNVYLAWDKDDTHGHPTGSKKGRWKLMSSAPDYIPPPPDERIPDDPRTPPPPDQPFTPRDGPGPEIPRTPTGGGGGFVPQDGPSDPVALENPFNLTHLVTWLERGGPSFLVRPQHFDDSVPDIRNQQSPAVEELDRIDLTTPIVVRLEGVGAQDGSVWDYTFQPGAGRYGGGTADGGLWVYPGDVGVEQDLGDTVAETTSTAILGISDYARLVFGRPNAETGGSKESFEIYKDGSAIKVDTIDNTGEITATGTLWPEAGGGTEAGAIQAGLLADIPSATDVGQAYVTTDKNGSLYIVIDDAIAWFRVPFADLPTETITAAWTFSNQVAFTNAVVPFTVASGTGTVSNLRADRWGQVANAVPAGSGRVFNTSSTTAGSWVAPGGDVSGAINSLTVTKLQNFAVSSSSPSTGRYLQWSGSAWTPVDLTAVASVFTLTASGSKTVAFDASNLSNSTTRTMTFPNVNGVFITSGNPWTILGSGATAFTDKALLYASSTSALSEIAPGTDTYVLTMVSGSPAWAAASSGTSALLSATHTDTVAASVTRGDLIVGNSTPKWARLPVGSANQVLATDGTDTAWATLSSSHLPATVAYTGSGNTFSVAQAIERTDAGTNTSLTALTLRRLTSGTAAASLGVDLVVELEDAASNTNSAARQRVAWSDATDGSEDATWTLALVRAGSLTDALVVNSLGQITTGEWEGTTVAIAKGGTGATDASGARTSLGLEIGVNVQAYDSELAAIAGLTSAADRLPYFTGSGAAALATFTAFGRSLVDDADAAAARATLDLEPGVDVQAYDAQLADLAGLSYSSNALKVVRVNAGETAFELATVSGGVTDHGALTGLSDDDHTQYALADGTRDFSGAVTVGRSDAGTNTSLTALTLRRLTSGTAAASLGVDLLFALEDSAGNTDTAARQRVSWSDATSTSEDATWTLALAKAGTLTNLLSVSSLGAVSITSGTIATSAPFSIAQTWDDGGAGTTIFHAFDINATLTSFDFANSTLFRVRASGASVFEISQSAATCSWFNVGPAGSFKALLNSSTGLGLTSDRRIEWGSSTSTTTGESGFARHAANVIRVGKGSSLSAANGVSSLLHGRYVQAKTTNYTVASSESFGVFTNEGASGSVTFSLPTAEANLCYTFIVQANQSLVVDAASGDTLRLAASVSASSGTLSSSTIGNTVTIVAINATEWIVTAHEGTWTVT